MGVAIQNTYTEEQIITGLTELALCASSETNASRRLAERGIHIPSQTLGDWKRRWHVERYQQIRAELLPQLGERIAGECESAAIHDLELATLARQRLADTVSDLPAKDAASALRNISTSMAINVDKAQLLRGKPTQRIARDPDDLWTKLERYLGTPSTAEEITDAELVDG